MKITDIASAFQPHIALNINWYYIPTWAEVGLPVLFLLANLSYMYRLWKWSRKLHQSFLVAFIKWSLRLAYCGLLWLALLGPSIGLGTKYVSTTGKDVFLLLDVSNSMLAQDLSPSRFEKMKQDLKQFLQGFPQERFGLIAFGLDAVLQCPLTLDHSALELYINILPAPKGSTRLSPALWLALEKHIVQTESADNKSQVVVLFTDGEDFGESVQTVLNEYKKRGLKLFTVALGTPDGGKIPREGGYKISRAGEVVVSKPNYTYLRQIAESTGGQSFELSNTRNELPALKQALNNITGREISMQAVNVLENKYEYALWLALLLIAFDVIILVKVLKI
jgi:Ca-activated chloride channel homolog